MTTVDELLEEAQKFGRVRVSQMRDGRWHSAIEFNTVDHVKLEAKSNYNHETAKDALIMAIEKAVLIVESLRSSTPKSTEDTQLKLGISQKIGRMLGVRK